MYHYWKHKSHSKLDRAILIADYILEGGHSTEDAAKEFRLGRTTIENEINYLGQEGYFREDKTLIKKFKDAKKALKKVTAEKRKATI